MIIFNEGQPGRDEICRRHARRTSQTIPVVGLSFADGAALYAATQVGPVTVHVVTSTENDPNRTTVNVIADSPEGKIKGQPSSSVPTSTR